MLGRPSVLLVGRRWQREGEFLWNCAGLITNLTEEDVRHVMRRGRSFAQPIWQLYDTKAGMEDE